MYREIQGWITTIEDIIANLPEITNDAPTEVYFKYFKDIADYLTSIAVKLRRYEDIERQSYFRIFQRSKRIRDFNGVALKQIDAAAKVFEGYQKKPSSYSKHKSVTALRSATNQLENLRDEVLTSH